MQNKKVTTRKRKLILAVVAMTVAIFLLSVFVFTDIINWNGSVNLSTDIYSEVYQFTNVDWHGLVITNHLDNPGYISVRVVRDKDGEIIASSGNIPPGISYIARTIGFFESVTVEAKADTTNGTYRFNLTW